MRKHFPVLLLAIILIEGCHSSSPIDRFSLVTRHSIRNTSIDSLGSLSVGNGDFAFTVDITGMQTFPENYSHGISLGTMSNWGWHTSPNPENYCLKDNYVSYNVHGRPVDYVRQINMKDDSVKGRASEWLRSNPHHVHLGMVGLQIIKKNGEKIDISDIENPEQDLDLWNGIIKSKFLIEGMPVKVYTVCHPDSDMISVKVISPLIADKLLKVQIHFPLGISAPTGYDFNEPGKHFTKLLSNAHNEALFERLQDSDRYYVRVRYSNGEMIKAENHLYYFEPEMADSTYEFSCCFSKNIIENEIPDFKKTEEFSRISWNKFWTSGGAVDFSECTDDRAFELERRVVLSQYLTRIQCSGFLPASETGLTYNSWFGKFHLEMHWWHAVHFALWQREDILRKQMEYYNHISQNALATAQHQGYDGLRWPKMTSPDGRESPSTVGTYLIWQQPHLIFFSELLYQNAKDKKEVLDRYSNLVSETAQFMASYAWFDSTANRYILGPVLIPAQESLKLETTINPTFELVYWYWGLKTAQEWRKRCGLQPEPEWDNILEKLSQLPVHNDLYICSEDTKDTYSNPRYMSDHPIVSGALGVMPLTKMVDKKIMSNTLDTIMKKWNWESTWGWDFSMLAMSAASLGRGDDAVNFLLMDAQKNRYLPNGHNYQNARLAIYLPGNGGLLTAVAKMCVEDQFPHNGKWIVRWESLNKYVK